MRKERVEEIDFKGDACTRRLIVLKKAPLPLEIISKDKIVWERGKEDFLDQERGRVYRGGPNWENKEKWKFSHSIKKPSKEMNLAKE